MGYCYGSYEHCEWPPMLWSTPVNQHHTANNMTFIFNCILQPIKNTNTMTIATTQLNQTQKSTCVKKSTPVKKVRGKDAVPFDEMERLMNVYGGIKALRNRGAPKKSNAEQGGSDKKAIVKKDSIKRK